jgi:hypothetical protein
MFLNHSVRFANYAMAIAISLLSADAIEPYDESRLAPTVLADNLTRPLELDIAPDGRVFFIELDGKLRIHPPKTGKVTDAATFEAHSVTARVASPASGGSVEIRQDTPDGPLIAGLEFDESGEWEKWIETKASVNDPGGIHDLCVVFVNEQNSGPFMNIDWLQFD